MVAGLSSQVFDASRLEMRVGLEQPDGSHRIQSIPLETYVARVLAGEAARESPPAALEALAIAIRTFALVNRNRHNADGFDVCDTTHCQVLRTATPVTERAAMATAGLVLVRNGVAVPVYYSASCGGRTEIPSQVWPGSDDPPYLPSQPDDACEGKPEWTADIKAADLTRSLKAAGFRGDRLREMRVVARNGSGRVSRLRVTGFQPDTISGQDLRAVVGRTLGWLLVKSAAFEMERRGDIYHFEGHGYGHGVGMCVIGSVNLAARGQTAAQILNRYYPGLDIVAVGGAPAVTSTPVVSAPAPAPAIGAVQPPPQPRISARPPLVLAPAAPSPVALALPDDDEGERAAIEAMALRARDELARDLGVAAPPRLTVRFHPTTQSYERATSQAWFTSGAIVGGEIHLLPLAVLRDRGVLERTIRHELVHLMVDEPLAKRPAWVREGAALYYSDVRSGRLQADEQGNERSRSRGRLSCPDDAELNQPLSAGSLSNAHARALACFARQAGDGRAWKDIR